MQALVIYLVLISVAVYMSVAALKLVKVCEEMMAALEPVGPTWAEHDAIIRERNALQLKNAHLMDERDYLLDIAGKAAAEALEMRKLLGSAQ